MKKHLALGTALLLTLGTAVAGTFLYGHEQGPRVERMVERQITLPSDTSPSHASSSDRGTATQSVTPEMIAMWKATAASTDYEAPKAPI